MTDTARLTAALAGRYAIERELGHGGMATVYLARDLKHDRAVAVKVLRPELAAVLGAERFLREIRISARLDHPHILTLIDSGESDGFVWYVLPYVRGESLRNRLDRNKQLGVDEALAITSQVAGALDYAHQQGVIHRDIKPENILFHEGEAVLADFGIALAVQEAAGNRLTETGLSLGTPQYMSPEQAAGDRQLDARSDVYSLAAVFYEMLAGEPPITGATVRAIIAKVLTERPARLSVVRDAVPEAIDVAVARALAKEAPDRFRTPGEFVHALRKTAGPRVSRRSARWLTAILAGGAGLGLLLVLTVTGRLGQRAHRATVGEQKQLTVTGNVTTPAISPDGKQVAYVTKHCTTRECTYAVVAQDVGGTAARTVLDGASSAGAIQWSPDRRYLLISGTMHGQFGSYLVSTLGGSPRFLGLGGAAFFAGGDSLLIASHAAPSDSVFWVRVTTLDGVVRDSIRVPGPGQGIWFITPVPGTPWIAIMVFRDKTGVWQIIDRHGRVMDRLINSCWCQGQATTDALWMARWGDTPTSAIVRVPIDRSSGRFTSRQDTMFSGLFTGFSLTDDGTALVVDEGSFDFGVWAVDLADALAGRFKEQQRIAHASTRLSGEISFDGSRVLLSRFFPSSTGGNAVRLTLAPYAGGAETPLALPGTPLSAGLKDSGIVATSMHTAHGTHLALIDTRSGAEVRGLDVPDSAISDFDVVTGGFAWIPAAGDRIVIRQGDAIRQVHKSAWYLFLILIAVDPSGRRLGYIGWNHAGDTIGVGVVSVDGGEDTQWARMRGEKAGVQVLGDGTLLLKLFQSEGIVTVYRLRGPGRVELIGTVPRPLRNLTISGDLKRAVVNFQDYRADAWLMRVLHR